MLDSNALLWATIDSPRLGALARTAITEPDSVVFFSLASIWELAIKSASGKLRVDENLAETSLATGFKLLELKADYCWRAAHLPRHHADPFDRLLLAQTMSEQLTLVTSDTGLHVYGIDLLHAER